MRELPYSLALPAPSVARLFRLPLARAPAHHPLCFPRDTKSTRLPAKRLVDVFPAQLHRTRNRFARLSGALLRIVTHCYASPQKTRVFPRVISPRGWYTLTVRTNKAITRQFPTAQGRVSPLTVSPRD